jgi:hypothetical protein
MMNNNDNPVRELSAAAREAILAVRPSWAAEADISEPGAIEVDARFFKTFPTSTEPVRVETTTYHDPNDGSLREADAPQIWIKGTDLSLTPDQAHSLGMALMSAARELNAILQAANA